MIISIISAIGKNNEIGKENKLLWSLPADMKHFRETTKGQTVIMGRKTFESIGKPLPGRRNIVVTRDTKYKKNGIELAHSLKEALGMFKERNEEMFIIGGAEIYKQAIEVADKLYITHVKASDKKADSFFPEIIPIVWNEVSHKGHKADEKNPYDYVFSVYDKFS
ncbi:MAG: dihydrofolate reductase [Patescibacteria group bacterium]